MVLLLLLCCSPSTTTRSVSCEPAVAALAVEAPDVGSRLLPLLLLRSLRFPMLVVARDDVSAPHGPAVVLLGCCLNHVRAACSQAYRARRGFGCSSPSPLATCHRPVPAQKLSTLGLTIVRTVPHALRSLCNTSRRNEKSPWTDCMEFAPFVDTPSFGHVGNFGHLGNFCQKQSHGHTE